MLSKTLCFFSSLTLHATMSSVMIMQHLNLKYNIHGFQKFEVPKHCLQLSNFFFVNQLYVNNFRSLLFYTL